MSPVPVLFFSMTVSRFSQGAQKSGGCPIPGSVQGGWMGLGAPGMGKGVTAMAGVELGDL